MSTSLELMTAEQLEARPRDDYRYELIRGELIKMSPAGGRQGSIGELFAIYFGHYVVTHRLGQVYSADTGFRMASNPDTVRAPDFAFIKSERVSGIKNPASYISIPPDLWLEVISPTDRLREIKKKAHAWLDFGATVVVVINPRNRTTTIYRSNTDPVTLAETDTIALPDLAPGWKLELADLFH